jgi:hypothetical protein
MKKAMRIEITNKIKNKMRNEIRNEMKNNVKNNVLFEDKVLSAIIDLTSLFLMRVV